MAILGALALAGCGATATGDSGAVRIVAAENFWGSIAAQLGGDKASVQQHHHQPRRGPPLLRADRRRTRARSPTAQLAIVNGVGYDPWAPKLIAANPTSGRTVLTVGDLFGLKDGDNPHRWYDPADVEAVANAITADLKKLDPKHASYFDRRRTRVRDPGPRRRYHALIAQIKRRYAATPVGASESIFALQAPALGLNLITPYELHEGDQRGHRGHRAGHAHHAAPAAATTRSRSGSTTPRTRRPRSSA